MNPKYYQAGVRTQTPKRLLQSGTAVGSYQLGRVASLPILTSLAASTLVFHEKISKYSIKSQTSRTFLTSRITRALSSGLI